MKPPDSLAVIKNQDFFNFYLTPASASCILLPQQANRRDSQVA